MGEKKFDGTAALVDDFCPLLAEALSGCVCKDTRAVLEPPRKLILWAEGRLVKVCLGAGDEHDKWFWSFHGLEAGLEKVEDALAKGQGDWVDPRGRKRR